jgi:PRTRC genetic system protein B
MSNKDQSFATYAGLGMEDKYKEFEDKVANNTPVPTTAIIVYESRNNNVFFSQHDVHVGDMGPSIGSGSVLTKADAHKFTQYIANKSDLSGEVLLPSNVLMNAQTKLVWVREPEIKKMWFKVGKKKVSYTVPWPRLIYVATPNGLSVYAIKGRRRPTADTKLYHAPLMNIYDDGRVCLGSARMPERFDLSSIPDMEAIITDTLFSHTNHDYTLKKRGKGEVSNTKHIQFWRNLHKDKATTFPNTALYDMELTLGEAIE